VSCGRLYDHKLGACEHLNVKWRVVVIPWHSYWLVQSWRWRRRPWCARTRCCRRLVRDRRATLAGIRATADRRQFRSILPSRRRLRADPSTGSTTAASLRRRLGRRRRRRPPDSPTSAGSWAAWWSQSVSSPTAVKPTFSMRQLSFTFFEQLYSSPSDR